MGAEIAKRVVLNAYHLRGHRKAAAAPPIPIRRAQNGTKTPLLTAVREPRRKRATPAAAAGAGGGAAIAEPSSRAKTLSVLSPLAAPPLMAYRRRAGWCHRAALVGRAGTLARRAGPMAKLRGARWPRWRGPRGGVRRVISATRLALGRVARPLVATGRASPAPTRAAKGPSLVGRACIGAPFRCAGALGLMAGRVGSLCLARSSTPSARVIAGARRPRRGLGRA